MGAGPGGRKSFGQHHMQSTFRQKSSSVRIQRGVTITEAMLAIGISALMIASVLGVYKVTRADVGVDELAGSTVKLVADIQSVFGATGGYAPVNAANISGAGLVPPGWRYDGANLKDNRGNTVVVTSAAGSFALVFGELAASDCSKAAVRLEGIATSIRVGTTADSAAGVISGGSVFKDTTGAISGANLATGCGQDSRKIAVQAR